MNNLPTTAQLYLLVTYSECCDIAKTAAEANILINDFNVQMRELELILGTKLIIRGERNSHLTKEGIEFVEEAKKILAQLHSATGKFRTEKVENTTTIKVGSLLTMGDILLDQDILYFENLYPEIKLEIYNHEASTLYELIENKELDVVVLFNYSDSKFDLTAYEQEPYISEPLVYYAPNLSLPNSTVSLQDLEPCPLVEYPPNFVMNKIFHKYLDKHNIKLNTVAWFSNPYAVINYCQQYLVGSFQCKRLLNQFGFYDGYYHLKPELSINYSIFYNKDNEKSNAINAFLSFLRDRNKQQ